MTVQGKLRENSEARKRDLVKWLQQNHLQQRVTRISKPGTINILFVDAPRTLLPPSRIASCNTPTP
ncbi:MAG: hypothetical protein SF123_17750 [Chloroflexota bacterium]|nr:hypothetical protein [Chloroflexota bacterium]